MTTPPPFSPGDKLRVIADKPYGTALLFGDLVTVDEVAVRVAPGQPDLPVVIVSTAHGRQILGLDVVERFDLPAYAPATPDDLVDAFLAKMAEKDPELSEVLTTINADFGAISDAATTLAGGGGGVAVAEEESPRRTVGRPFVFTDRYDDDLEVTYSEQDTATGRQGGFLFVINDDTDNTVLIPARQVEPLIKYLFQMKKHSERPQ